MRPRPAGPFTRAPRSPWARARVRPQGFQTYRAQADPKCLRAAPRPGQPAARRAGTRESPTVQEHFFGRQDTRLLLLDYSLGCPGWSSLTRTCSWRRLSWAGPPSLPPAAGGGGARSSHLSGAGGVRPAELSGGPALLAPLATHRLPGLPPGRTEIWRPPDSLSLIPAPN